MDKKTVNKKIIINITKAVHFMYFPQRNKQIYTRYLVIYANTGYHMIFA